MMRARCCLVLLIIAVVFAAGVEAQTKPANNAASAPGAAIDAFIKDRWVVRLKDGASAADILKAVNDGVGKGLLRNQDWKRLR